MNASSKGKVRWGAAGVVRTKAHPRFGRGEAKWASQHHKVRAESGGGDLGLGGWEASAELSNGGCVASAASTKV